MGPGKMAENSSSENGAAMTLREQLSKYLQHAADCDLVTWPKGIPIGGPEPYGDGTYYTEPTECTCGLQQAADRLASLEQLSMRYHGLVCEMSRAVVPDDPEKMLRQLIDDRAGLMKLQDKLEAQVASLEHELAVATGARDAFRQSRDTLEAVVASLEQAQQALRAQIQQVMGYTTHKMGCQLTTLIVPVVVTCECGQRHESNMGNRCLCVKCGRRLDTSATPKCTCGLESL